MTTTRVKGPGVRVLDTPIKSISDFENFRHSMIFYLRQDSDFKPYLRKDVVWGRKTGPTSNRNLHNDAGVSENPPVGQTAAEKCEIVDFMLETISIYCPLIPQDDIFRCESLDAVWKVIRLHNDIESSGVLLNSLWNVTRQPNESPQALWSRLKQQYDDSLLRKNTHIYRWSVEL